MTATNPLVGFEESFPYRDDDTAIRHRERIQRSERIENKRAYRRSTSVRVERDVITTMRDLYGQPSIRPLTDRIAEALGISERTVDMMLATALLKALGRENIRTNAQKNIDALIREAEAALTEEMEELLPRRVEA